ncbi:hypothetical protein BgAZ_502850 [Babesia gibsoni]|uniref:Uncharacterized protein n=1 Tax=Babesia gibsoni TaxID=33632 RepID=A0AAD8LM65_BABGI|nr:hypothetical protein BgAZ_502850 [Babesia gibsoni]
MKSIVSEKPGTTRDAKHGQVYLKGRRITLVDTGGIESLFSNSLNRKGSEQVDRILSHIEGETVRAVEKSDMVLFVVDGQEGITPLDVKMANKLKEWSKEMSKDLNVNLIVNKLDREGSEEYYEAMSDCFSECYSLNLGDPLFVSAHSPSSIQRLRELICCKLKLSSRDTIKKLEEMALLSDSLPAVYGGSDETLENAPEEEKEMAEIDKSIRVCSTVTSSFRPNDRWIRLLNNICDTVPFSTTDDEKHAIPAMLSPAEQLAKMYISNDTEKLHSSKAHDEQHETNWSSSDHSACTLEKEEEPVIPQNIKPIRVLLVGSVEGFQNRLARLLTDGKIEPDIGSDFLSESLSPNWHNFYGKWMRRMRDNYIPQPVEVFTAAALNLGGSLGKVASLQTRHLIRKADVVIMCVKAANQRSQSKVSLTKKEMACMGKIIHMHKPILLVVEAPKTPQRNKLRLDLDKISQEFAEAPILTVRMRQGNAEGDNEPSESPDINNRRRLGRLKKEIISIIDKGEKMIETNKLNNWLRSFLAKWPPPWYEGAKVNVKFAAQVRGSPPTFVMWSNVYGNFPQHYLRQLKQALSAEFGFHGVPLKFLLRTTAEPKSTSRRDKLSWKRKIHNI